MRFCGSDVFRTRTNGPVVPDQPDTDRRHGQPQRNPQFPVPVSVALGVAGLIKFRYRLGYESLCRNRVGVTDLAGLVHHNDRGAHGAQIAGGCDDCDAYSYISASSWHHSTGWLLTAGAASLEQPITQPIPPLREHAHHLPDVPIGLGDEIQGFDQIPGLFAIQCQWRPVIALQFQLPLQTEGQDPVDLRAGVDVASTGQICKLEQVAIGHVVHRDSECRCHGE